MMILQFVVLLYVRIKEFIFVHLKPVRIHISCNFHDVAMNTI